MCLNDDNNEGTSNSHNRQGNTATTTSEISDDEDGDDDDDDDDEQLALLGPPMEAFKDSNSVILEQLASVSREKDCMEQDLRHELRMQRETPGGNHAAPQTMRPGDNGVPVMSPGGPPQTMRPGGPPTMKPSLAKDDMYYKAQSSSYIHANTPPDMRPEFTRAQSSRAPTSTDHPAPPVHLPHENKIEVPRSESTNMSGDKYVAEMLKKRFEQEQQAKRTGNIEDLADDELNDFDDAIHLGHMPKNMGTGTPAAHRPLVGGFAAAAYEAARAYHFQHQGAEVRRSSKQDRKPPPSI